MQETWVRSLGQEDPLDKRMTTTPVSITMLLTGYVLCCAQSLSCVSVVTPWTVAHQAPLPVEFSK